MPRRQLAITLHEVERLVAHHTVGLHHERIEDRLLLRHHVLVAVVLLLLTNLGELASLLGAPLRVGWERWVSMGDVDVDVLVVDDIERVWT